MTSENEEVREVYCEHCGGDVILTAGQTCPDCDAYYPEEGGI